MIQPAYFLLGLVLGCSLLQARNEVPLPAWNEQERKDLEKSGWDLKALVLTDEAEPDTPPDPALIPLEMVKPALDVATAEPSPAIRIPEKYLESYFGARPQTYLVDPQNLLQRRAARDRLGMILKDHANDSAIDLFIYVFNKGQAIPSEVRDEELIERFFSEGRPAMIAFYYLGAPQQSTLYLSPALTDGVPAAEQRRALQSAIMQASDKATPDDQLEAFAVQLAMRIYWMERLLGGNTTAGDDAQQRGQTRPPKPAKKTSFWLTEKWAELRLFGQALALPGMAVAGALASALGIGVWLRWRATYQFPVFAVEPRLGGNHAAGAGALICFSSVAPPPQSQREQVAEASRRY